MNENNEAEVKADKPDEKLLFRNPMNKGAYRNNPCICGSGKKLKQCHGREPFLSAEDYKQLHILGAEHNQRTKEFNDMILQKAQEMSSDNG